MTASSETEPSPIDNTWSNQDRSQRLLTLEKLDPSNKEHAAFINEVAQNDEHEEVRCNAISRISDIEVLEKLLGAGGKVNDSAQQQIYRIIAGTVDSQHSEADRIAKLQKLPASGIKQVTLITKLKTIGNCGIEALSLNEDLADLCLFASYVHVRKTAAEKIEDTELLQDILTRVQGKDKTVSKLIGAKLSADSGANKQESSTPDPQEQKKTAKAASGKAKEAEKSRTGKSQEKSQENSKHNTTKANDTPSGKTASETEATPSPAIDPREAFLSVEAEATKLSFKNTSRLFEIRSQLRKLRERIKEVDTELLNKIGELLEALEAKIEKNNEYQSSLKQKTEELLGSLAEALDAGNSEIATQHWDKIQGNISNTANQVRAELQKEANKHKDKIKELRDWKIFASTEKKKELITQMEHLLQSKMHASDRSKSISKMHKEWKELGRSNQNEQLWKQFKTLSDKAYEPCKEYFKQRKQQMADNLLKRREICDKLEAEHKALSESESEVDISKLNKLLSAAEKEWKLHAPIEQSKIKSLQKRFYGTVNQLRKMRKGELSHHAQKKQELIKLAQELVKHEDAKHAMNEAKRLQQEWKKVGPTTYREDNKYWQEFRAACDSIFGKRNEASSRKNEELLKVESRLKEILQQLSSIASKGDDDLRESRSAYHELAQEFSNTLDPRLKSQRKRLLDQFNAAKRQIDSRIRALPDKRQQLIQQQILARVELLKTLESELLAEQDADKFASRQQAFSKESFSAMASSDNTDLENLLTSRLSAVLAANNAAALVSLCDEAEVQFRELCVLAEIRANTDSPPEDKALRMRLQLEQLQSGFGKAKPDQKENLKYAANVELSSYVIGPLSEPASTELSDRLRSVLQKLR